MGLGGISWPQLLIVLAIVLLIFGTKRLKNFGSDLGGAVKGFKDSIKDEDQQLEEQAQDTIQESSTAEQAEAGKKD